MTFPIEYIKIPASILCRTELSDKAMMLLGLINGFGSNGLMLSNVQLARVLRTTPNHITKLLTVIKNHIHIKNPQSKYRKIFYSIHTDEVESIPVNPRELSNNTLLNPSGGLLNPNGLDTQSSRIDINKVTKKNINITSPQESPRFVKPAPEQVQAYAQSIGYCLDGQIFCDYYESKGWMIGKSKMRDWQAAVRTWQRNQNTYSKKDKLPRISQEVKNDGNYETITA
jgi:hypothetical protein